MSKTIEIQVEKSNNLIQGLRKLLSEGGTGITATELSQMEKEVKALAAASDECERLRAELAPKVRRMNEILADVKNKYVERKAIIKERFPQERWADYGLADKR